MECLYDYSKTKIVIITRFGIGIKETEWYDYRYVVHKTFGQDCILNQTNTNFEWIICLDSNPPNYFIDNLENDFKQYNNIHLLKINKDFVKEYRIYIEENILTVDIENIILIRKDDDDSLNINFIENIYTFLKKNHIDLYFIDESDLNMSYVKELYNGWSWGDNIFNLFSNDTSIIDNSIIDNLYFSINNKELKIYYKNDYIQTVGPREIYGDINNQLTILKEKIINNSTNMFKPFAIINNNGIGYQYMHKFGKNNIYLTNFPGSPVGLYSILPTKNKKLTHFIDCMYDNKYGHYYTRKTKGVLFNDLENISSYIFVRGLINDCNPNPQQAYLVNKEVLLLNDCIIKEFNINNIFLEKFIIKNNELNNIPIKKYNYIVDKNLYDMRKTTKKILITIDTEAQLVRASDNHVDKLIYGRFGTNKNSGIMEMMILANKYDVKLIFFLDIAEIENFGLDIFKTIVNDIYKNGHDVQIHFHPDQLPAEWFTTRNLKRKCLDTVSYEDAFEMFTYIEKQIKILEIKSPIAFRGGGWRYNQTVIEVMNKFNYKFSFHYNPSTNKQKYNDKYMKIFKHDNEIIEIPLTTYKYNNEQYKSVDITTNWDKTINKLDEDIIVFVLHSWSLNILNKETGFFNQGGDEQVNNLELFFKYMNQSKYKSIDTNDLLNLINTMTINKVNIFQHTN